MEEYTHSLVQPFSIRASTGNASESFTCGEPRIDSFLRSDAFLCHQNHYLSLYEAFIQNTGEIIAYFSLSNDVIQFPDHSDRQDLIELLSPSISSEYRELFGEQLYYPAVNIPYLAVHKDFQGRNIGSGIIRFIYQTYQNIHYSGCQFITIDAINKANTLRFYEKNGFEYLTLNDAYKPTRRMFRYLFVG